MKYYLYLLLIFCLCSCKANYSFLEKYPTKNVPLVDSISFTNSKHKKLLTNKQKRNLKLDSLFSKNLKIGISYKPLLSKKYQSIVYYFYLDEHNLQSVLVNYDNLFNIIDMQLVASSEKSDNLLRTTSIIYKDKIKLNEYNFQLSKLPTELLFLISSNGKITRK